MSVDIWCLKTISDVWLPIVSGARPPPVNFTALTRFVPQTSTRVGGAHVANRFPMTWPCATILVIPASPLPPRLRPPPHTPILQVLVVTPPPSSPPSAWGFQSLPAPTLGLLLTTPSRSHFPTAGMFTISAGPPSQLPFPAAFRRSWPLPSLLDALDCHLAFVFSSTTLLAALE